MIEIWKDISGYEGLYQVSNTGKIKTLEKKCWNKYSFITRTERILKQNNSKGYNFVRLYKNKKAKNFTIHKLVALTFLSNEFHYKEINHIDGNKLNNCVNNLEWCSKSHNIRHAFIMGLNKARKGNKNEKSIKIIQYDKNMNKIKLWDCISDVERKLNINHSSIIRCAKYKQETAGGYRWRYME